LKIHFFRGRFDEVFEASPAATGVRKWNAEKLEDPSGFFEFREAV